MPTGRDLVRLATKHVGERYVLGSRVPMSNAQWKGPWDCAEFASWCVFQLTGELFGCRPKSGNPDAVESYTGFWGDDARKQKVMISVDEAAATIGAFVLRLPSANGIGHIVISDGKGGTVEAASARRGVTTGSLDDRRWSMGILVPGIDTKTPNNTGPVATPGLVLFVQQPPIKSPLVKAVQRAVKNLGYSPGPLDGIYGLQTAAAVRAFQVDKGLVADGEVGPVTAKALAVDWP